MKFGFFMMPLHRPGENPTLAFQRDLELIEYADRLGYDEFLVGEHHSAGWETIPAPDIFLAAAAERTRRIRLGTAVINLPYHHPFHVAERMAFLDQLTQGRIIMGVGPGGLAPDVKLFGLEPQALRSMMNESLDIIMGLFRANGPITYEGKHWQLKDMELQLKCYQQPHLPVAAVSMGGGNALEQAAKHGLMLISAGYPMRAGALSLRDQWSQLQKLAASCGTQIPRADWRVSQYLYVAESDEQAVKDIALAAPEEAREYYVTIGGKEQYEEYPGQPAEELTIDQLLRTKGWIVGSPETCVRKIRALGEAAGGFGGMLFVSTEWVSQEKTNRSLELFARYVMPQFQPHLPSLQRAWQRTVDDRRGGRLPDMGAPARPRA